MSEITVTVEGGPADGHQVTAHADPDGTPQETALIAVINGHAALLRSDPSMLPVGHDWVLYRRHGSTAEGWTFRPAGPPREPGS